VARVATDGPEGRRSGEAEEDAAAAAMDRKEERVGGDRR
jgi:hypothetical protein